MSTPIEYTQNLLSSGGVVGGSGEIVTKNFPDATTFSGELEIARTRIDPGFPMEIKVLDLHMKFKYPDLGNDPNFAWEARYSGEAGWTEIFYEDTTTLAISEIDGLDYVSSSWIVVEPVSKRLPADIRCNLHYMEPQGDGTTNFSMMDNMGEVRVVGFIED
jgi:hypothetical protein